MKYKPVPREFEDALIAQAQAGDQEMKAVVLSLHKRFIAQNAKRWSRSQEEFEEMVQEGNLGMLEALQFYEGGRVRFLTYSGRWVLRNMKKHRLLLDGMKGCWLPNGTVQDKPPKPAFVSLDTGTWNDERGAAPGIEPAAEGGQEHVCKQIDVERLLARLGPRDRYVVERYYLVSGRRGRGKTLNEIGETLALTRERIRQIKLAAILKLSGYAR